MRKRLVVGILAHVDAGKTTLIEALLYEAGATRALGRVDHKNAFLDTHATERARGITIFSKQALFSYENTDFTVIDTPGHADFTPEAERALSILDCAVLVISGSEGVQSHTKTLWQLLERNNIPTMVFINKTDMPTVDKDRILADLSNDLTPCIIDISNLHDETVLEKIALCDEALLDTYMQEGDIPFSHIVDAINSRKLFPCIMGSALKLVNITSLLSGLCSFITTPDYDEDFSANIHKIFSDDKNNRLTFMKITGGSLRVRNPLTYSCAEESVTEKITEIRLYSGEKYKNIDEALPGMVVAVAGLSKTSPGMRPGKSSQPKVNEAFNAISYRIRINDKTDAFAAHEKLRRLAEEEPDLGLRYDEKSRSLFVQLMGEIRMEVLETLIKDRFGIDVSFVEPRISYRETILSTSYGVGHYEPLGHYAEVHLSLSPAERGTGMVYKTSCPDQMLESGTQQQILHALASRVHYGVLTGSPVTDIEVTLVAARIHNKHTVGGDLRQAAYRALRHGLMMAESRVLEPHYNFTLSVPKDALGRALFDLETMGAKLSSPSIMEDTATIEGSAGIAAMGEYPLSVAAYTKGMGRLVCKAGGYHPAANERSIIDERGYLPTLDDMNPIHSIFCAHGAGFMVPYQDVYSHMHIECAIKRKKVQEPFVPRKHTTSEADDAALMRIFERTYGPIKDYHKAGLGKRSSNSVEKFPAQYSIKEEYLLVDGYNMIFAWDSLKSIAKEDISLARFKLIDYLHAYRAMRGGTLIVVFDAYKVQNNRGHIEKEGNLYIVYTKEAETADMYIEKVTSMLKSNRNVRVATSDALEQLIILGHGALRVSASMFESEVMKAQEDLRAMLRDEQAANKRSGAKLFDITSPKI